MTIAIIIPARFESVRLPGKPLALISGKPMIEWVVDSASKAKLANKIIVATEDERIFNFVKDNLKADPCMTSKSHKSGTDRVYEVVKKYPDIKYIINFQGDEPLMPSEYVDKVIKLLVDEKQDMASLIAPMFSIDDLNNPNVVKAVIDKDGYALYFSRSPIPFNRSESPANPQSYYRHIGIYGYSREALMHFNSLPPSHLEQLEQLEQLRALENGIKIKLDIVPKAYPAVDTVQDIKEVEKILASLKM